MKPDRRACFHKLCILFFIVFKNTSPTTSSHSALFGFIRTFDFDESKKTGACVNLNPGHSEISWILVSTLKLGCELNIINPLPNLALVTALKGDDRSVSRWLRSNLREGDFLPAVNTAAARIQIKPNCTGKRHLYNNFLNI